MIGISYYAIILLYVYILKYFSKKMLKAEVELQCTWKEFLGFVSCNQNLILFLATLNLCVMPRFIPKWSKPLSTPGQKAGMKGVLVA